MSSLDLHLMELALGLADRAAREGEVPVGALVVRGEEVLGTGWNRREAWQDPTAHAEVLALREASSRLGSWRLEGCTLVVTLEPCAMCAGAAILARVERVVFGASDPKGGMLGSLGHLHDHPGLNHRMVVQGDVLAEASAQRLRDFFRSRRSPI